MKINVALAKTVDGIASMHAVEGTDILKVADSLRGLSADQVNLSIELSPADLGAPLDPLANAIAMIAETMSHA